MLPNPVVITVIGGLTLIVTIILSTEYPGFAKVTNNGELILLSIGGILGLWIAVSKVRTADNTVKQDRFKLAAELLDKGRHSCSVAGASILSDLLENNFGEYGPMAEDVLESIVLYPPHFDNKRHPEDRPEVSRNISRVVDYAAGQVVISVNALNGRTPFRRLNRRLKFLGDEAFIETADGSITPNPKHPSYKYWEDHPSLPHPLSLYVKVEL